MYICQAQSPNFSHTSPCCGIHKFVLYSYVSISALQITSSVPLCMYIACVHAKWLQSCPTLCNPMDYRQEYRRGLPCPLPRDLCHLGIKTTSLTSPALVDGLFTTSATWGAYMYVWDIYMCVYIYIYIYPIHIYICILFQILFP